MRKQEEQVAKVKEQITKEEKPTTNLPVSQEAIMSSNGVQNQPSPLEQILANQTGMANQIPVEQLM